MTPILLVAGALVAAPSDPRAGEPAVRLTVQPMAAPKPALKYLLLPEVRELKPGNPAQWYLRCFAEQRTFFFSKQGTEERARYLAMPLAELPKDQLRNYGGSALTQADWGARLLSPDWEALQRVQTGGTDLVLPELAPLKLLGMSLRVRFRGEVAGRRYDDAVATAKTMFALSRHLGEHPTVAGNLLGVSVAQFAVDTLEEMVQQPDSPNLYWALTDLPCPLVDLRKGVQGDRSLADSVLRPIRGDVALSDADAEEVVSHLSGRMGFAREQA